MCAPLAACWPLAAQDLAPSEPPAAPSPADASASPESAAPDAPAGSAADAPPSGGEARAAAPPIEDLLGDIAPLPRSTEPAQAEPQGIGNEDVLAMVRAQFSESTIVAAIQVNETHFDVSPRALLALKQEGVPERVLEAMLAAAAAKRQAALAVAQPAVAPAAAAEQQAPQAGVSPEEIARLSAAIERLTTRSDDAPQEPEQASSAGNLPTVWLIDGGVRVRLEPTLAQVATTDMKRFGGTALRTLQGLAGKALAFATPALAVASGLSGLFRDDDPDRTLVWALLGPSSPRKLSADTVFEVEYGGIPGVNPDEYRPAIVQLVPTSDNYRLVGAAKTSGDGGGLPSGPIIQELVEAKLTPLGRGHYQVALPVPLASGEYALVLRPVAEPRGRERRAEASLGELMGGGSGQILYLTWDFSIGG